MNKSYRAWEEARQWCLDHPGQKYMIAMIDGGFVMTWEPKPEYPKGRIWFDTAPEAAAEQEPKS